jgi:hypothetical protein
MAFQIVARMKAWKLRTDTRCEKKQLKHDCQRNSSRDIETRVVVLVRREITLISTSSYAQHNIILLS